MIPESHSKKLQEMAMDLVAYAYDMVEKGYIDKVDALKLQLKMGQQTFDFFIPLRGEDEVS